MAKNKMREEDMAPDTMGDFEGTGTDMGNASDDVGNDVAMSESIVDELVAKALYRGLTRRQIKEALMSLNHSKINEGSLYFSDVQSILVGLKNLLNKVQDPDMKAKVAKIQREVKDIYENL